MLRRVLSRAPLPPSLSVYPMSKAPRRATRRTDETTCRVSFLSPHHLTNTTHLADSPPPWFTAAVGEVEWISPVPVPSSPTHPEHSRMSRIVAGLGSTASVRDYRLALTRAIRRVVQARAAASASASAAVPHTMQKFKSSPVSKTFSPSATHLPSNLIITPPTSETSVWTQSDVFQPARALTERELTERTACFAVTAAYRYDRLRSKQTRASSEGLDGSDAAHARATGRRASKGVTSRGSSPVLSYSSFSSSSSSSSLSHASQRATAAMPERELRLIVDSPHVSDIHTGAIIGACVNDARNLGNLRHDEGTPEFYVDWVRAAIPSRPVPTQRMRLSGVLPSARTRRNESSSTTSSSTSASSASSSTRAKRESPSHFSASSSVRGLVSHRILRGAAIRRAGLHLLYNVGKGAVHEPHVLLLEYMGQPRSRESVALIGKGVTFDSGGLNVKPYGSMETMHTDMMGAATVLCALKAVVTLQLPVNVVVAVGLVENAIGPASYHPSTILTSLRGSTVEVVNTDAEGRLVLADLFTYVQRDASLQTRPRTMIDVATLTGAVVMSLGQRRAGLFSDSASLTEQLMSCGRACGEELWPLPVGEEHVDMMKSGMADWRNAGAGKYAGASSAAAFLSHFVDRPARPDGRRRWAHVDIAGTANNGDAVKGFEPAGVTGFGVQLLVDYLRLPQVTGNV